jgi:hypothetical protein
MSSSSSSRNIVTPQPQTSSRSTSTSSTAAAASFTTSSATSTTKNAHHRGSLWTQNQLASSLPEYNEPVSDTSEVSNQQLIEFLSKKGGTSTTSDINTDITNYKYVLENVVDDQESITQALEKIDKDNASSPTATSLKERFLHIFPTKDNPKKNESKFVISRHIVNRQSKGSLASLIVKSYYIIITANKNKNLYNI